MTGSRLGLTRSGDGVTGSSLRLTGRCQGRTGSGQEVKGSGHGVRGSGLRLTGSTLRLTGSGLALTSRAPLLALSFLPAVEFSEGLGRLLQFGDEELNVIQQVVQDLLPDERDISVGRASQWAEPVCGRSCSVGRAKPSTSVTLTTSRSTRAAVISAGPTSSSSAPPCLSSGQWDDRFICSSVSDDLALAC